MAGTCPCALFCPDMASDERFGRLLAQSLGELFEHGGSDDLFGRLAVTTEIRDKALLLVGKRRGTDRIGVYHVKGISIAVVGGDNKPVKKTPTTRPKR